MTSAAEVAGGPVLASPVTAAPPPLLATDRTAKNRPVLSQRRPMAVSQQISVDPSGSVPGLAQVGRSEQKDIVAAEKGFTESGDAELDALDERIRRVRDLAQAVKELSREQEHGADRATQAVADLTREIRNLSEAWTKTSDLKTAADSQLVAAMKATHDMLARQWDLANQQILAAKEGLRLAEQLAREQAQQAAELEEIQIWQQSVSRLAEANAESGRRRRARQNSF